MSNILFVLDPVDTLTVKKDTSLALMWAAQRRGWEVFTCELGDLFWVIDAPEMFACRTVLHDDWERKHADSAKWYSQDAKTRQSASYFDIIMMRKDPPFNMDYINATYMLDEAEKQGALVCNKPSSLRDCNEKFFTTTFHELTPKQVISQREDVLLEFHAEYKDVIFKPLDGMGGKGIFRIDETDPNLHVVIETLTNNFQTQIVAQQFIPEIRDGDKRILIINGNTVPYALARIPKEGEARGNLAAGGKGIGQELTARDLEIAEAVAPVLVDKGLYFTGIDVIGDYLTEINVTCPTCVRELDREFNLDIGSQLMDELETIRAQTMTSDGRLSSV